MFENNQNNQNQNKNNQNNQQNKNQNNQQNKNNQNNQQNINNQNQNNDKLLLYCKKRRMGFPMCRLVYAFARAISDGDICGYIRE